MEMMMTVLEKGVAISGNYAIVGAYYDEPTDSGSAYIFNVSTGSQLHKLTGSDGSRYSLECLSLSMVIMLL